MDKFPTLTFVSSRVVKKSAEHFDVVGTFTIRDVSKEITVPVTFLGLAKDPWGNMRAGFEGEITVNRKDYGLAWNATLETGGFLVGDEVEDQRIASGDRAVIAGIQKKGQTRTRGPACPSCPFG